jgi:hypothetical protein
MIKWFLIVVGVVLVVVLGSGILISSEKKLPSDYVQQISKSNLKVDPVTGNLVSK